MPVTGSKITLLMHATTFTDANQPVRTGGFSETLYSSDAADDPALIGKVTALGMARVKLLGNNCGLVGYRVQNVTITGPQVVYGSTIGRDWVQPGADGRDNDHPNMALKFALRGTGNLNERQYTLCAVPDEAVKRGEFSNVNNFANKIQDYVLEISKNFKMLATVKTNPLVKLVSIIIPDQATTATYTTRTPHGLVATDWVKLHRSYKTDGKTVSGNYQVATAPTPTTFTLWSSPFNFITVTPDRTRPGSVRKQEMALLGVTSDLAYAYPKACTRKVGAPFSGFVGRS